MRSTARPLLPASVLAAVCALLALPGARLPAQEAAAAPSPDQGSEIEIPEDLSPEGDNRPLLPEAPEGGPRFDDQGFPEDSRGLLLASLDGEDYLVHMRGEEFPYLLYAQFANRQRDAVFLAREGAIADPLPDGTLVDIPYGWGALKTTTAYISIVEALLVPHVSDNQKAYERFPLRDLYAGISADLTGIQGEARYVDRERLFAYGRLGFNYLAGVGGAGLAPFNYTVLAVHLGGGVGFPGLLQSLIGDNHWYLGADLHLGFGDADRDPATPAVIWMPGVFFELEKRNLFGWGGKWVGFDEHGDYREDARPLNYHVRALYARLGIRLDVQNGPQTGWVELDAGIGFRNTVIGPRIPPHPFKETRVLYLSDKYRTEILRQREERRSRIERSRSGS